MPIRINLKELFNSDSQEITIDKLNFNFNKILELGVGKTGPLGPKGPKGSAGPKGLTGDKGDRGNNWFIGSGSPQSQTFTGLMELDFYIDTLTGSIWQYSGGTWTQLVNFSSVISGYLNTLGSTFERGLGIGTNVDTKFIRFVNRGNNISDITNDLIGGSSNNDILFLDNFNENANLVNVINFPTNPDDLYTSLQRIYVDNSTGVPGRFHLDFGTIYPDTIGDLLFTNLKHNFKLSQYVDNITGGGTTYPNTNTYIYTSKLNASISDLAPINDVDFNSVFELKTAKYNNEAPFPNPPFKGNLITRIGSREALGEYSNHVLADGISFTLQSYVSNLGIAYNYSSSNSILNGKQLFMLDGNSSMNGMLIDLRTYINQDTDIFGVLNVGDRSASDATINVGANRTANGAAQLDLIGDTTNTNYGFRVRRNSGVNGTSEMLHLGTGNLELNTVNAASIALKTNSATRATITSAGLVGIGTTTPSSQLHVNGSFTVLKVESSIGESFIDISSTTSAGTARIGFTAADTALKIINPNNIKFLSNSLPNLTLNTDGYASFGSPMTTNDHRVEINGVDSSGSSALSFPLLIRTQGSTFGTSSNGLLFQKSKGGPFTFLSLSDVLGTISFGGSAGAAGVTNGTQGGARIRVVASGAWGISSRPTDIAFETSSSTSLAERMIIKAGGNVGVGTSAPNTKLDVDGQITMRGSSPAADYMACSDDATGKMEWRSPAIVAGTLMATNLLVPTGTIIMWAGLTSQIPSGWLLCDGTAVSATLFPNLRQFLIDGGNLFGSSGGNPRRPDLRERFVVGAGGNSPSVLGTTGYTIGEDGGENSHVLTNAELPKHTHKLDHGVDGASMSDPGNHFHQVPYRNAQYNGSTNKNPGDSNDIDYYGNTTGAGAHKHTGNTGDGTTDGLAGQAHENRPPFLALCYLIKT